MERHDPFTVRSASARDREAALALVPRLRASQPATFRGIEELDAGEARTLRRFFDGNPAGAMLWVAEDASAVIGIAYAERATDYFTQETHGHLGILAVAEHAEGRGIGRALLQTVENWNREAGFRVLTLNVFASNAHAIAVYEKSGYRADFVRYLKLMSP
jgi:GNAT superfamily N-acetyltransferase